MMPFIKRKEAFMKKTILLYALASMFTAVFFSCGEKGANPKSGPAALDTTVVGKWYGAIGAIKIPTVINFNGEKIFVNISGADSAFALITRDTTRTATPLISDTTL